MQTWWENDKVVEPSGYSTLKGPVDPLVPFKTTSAANDAAASVYDPATAAARAREAEANARIAEANARSAGDVKAAEQKTQQEMRVYNSAIKSLENQIRVTEGIWEKNFKGGYPNPIVGRIPSGASGEFDTAGKQLLDVAQSILRVPGLGSQDRAEFLAKIGAYVPKASDTDKEIKQKLEYLKMRTSDLGGALGLPPIDWENRGETLDRTRQTVSDAGAGVQQKEIARGKTQTIESPMLKAIGSQLGKMIANGVPDDKIIEFVKKSGLDPSSGQLGPVLEFRRSDPRYKEWKRLNPKKAYPIDPAFWQQEVELPPAANLFDKAAGTGVGETVGAYALQAGQGITGNRLDDIAEALGGNAENVRTGTDLIRQEHPYASFAGDLSGQAMLEMTAGRLPGARAALANPWGRRAADAVYGGYSGSGINDEDPTAGAASGALGGTLLGMAGRGAQRGLGAAGTGVRDETLQYLNARDVPLTIGEIARASDSLPGRMAAWTEDRLAGLPGTDAMVNTARARGQQGFNQAMFGEAGAPIGANISEVGEPGVMQLGTAVKGAYDKALKGVRLVRDQDFDADLTAARAAGVAIPDLGKKVDYVLRRSESLFDGGIMTGKRVQDALRILRKAKSEFAGQPLGGEAVTALDQAEQSFIGMVQRQAPEVMEGLNEANKAYGNKKIIQRAMGGMAAQRNDSLVSPQQLNQAAIQNTKKFGGEDLAMSGGRPFYDLSKAGMDAMTQQVPDSGTAGRSAIVPLIGGAMALGGEGASALAGEDTAADTAGGYGRNLGLLTLAASLPYSKAGQRGIQAAMLGERPVIMNEIGEYLKKHPLPGGLLGQAGFRDYYNRLLASE